MLLTLEKAHGSFYSTEKNNTGANPKHPNFEKCQIA